MSGRASRTLAVLALVAVGLAVFVATRARPDAEALGPGVPVAERQGSGTGSGGALPPAVAGVARPSSSVEVTADESGRARAGSLMHHALRVHGRVYDVTHETEEDSDLDGIPLAGVSVRLVALAGSEEPGCRLEAHCTTDERGRFTSTFRVPDSWRCEDWLNVDVRAFASPPGFVPAEEWGGVDLQGWIDEAAELGAEGLDPGACELELDFWLEVGGAVSGRVLESTGQPAEGAEVALVDAEDVRAESTDEQGRYTIAFEESGTYSLHARQPHTGTAWLPAITVTTDAPNAAPDLVLAGPGTITGRVRDPDGRALEGVRVGVTAASSADSESAGLRRPGAALSGWPTSADRGAGLRSATTKTDSKGRFWLHGLEAGRYPVIAWAEPRDGRLEPKPVAVVGPTVDTPAAGVELVLPLHRLEVRVAKVPDDSLLLGGSDTTRITCGELEPRSRALPELSRQLRDGRLVARFQVQPGGLYSVGTGRESGSSFGLLGLSTFIPDGAASAEQPAERAPAVLHSPPRVVRIPETPFLTVVELEWPALSELGVIRLSVRDAEGGTDWSGRGLVRVLSDAGGLPVGERWIGREDESLALAPGTYHLELGVLSFGSPQGVFLVEPSGVNAFERRQFLESSVPVLRRTVRVTAGEVVPLELRFGGGAGITLELTDDPDAGASPLPKLARLEAQVRLITATGTRVPAGSFLRSRPPVADGVRYVSERQFEFGTYDLELTLPGRAPARARVTVRAGEPALARFALRAADREPR